MHLGILLSIHNNMLPTKNKGANGAPGNTVDVDNVFKLCAWGMLLMPLCMMALLALEKVVGAIGDDDDVGKREREREEKRRREG